jgi:hypothetical protein
MNCVVTYDVVMLSVIMHSDVELTVAAPRIYIKHQVFVLFFSVLKCFNKKASKAYFVKQPTFLLFLCFCNLALGQNSRLYFFKEIVSITTRGQCYKSYFVRNLRIFVIS